MELRRFSRDLLNPKGLYVPRFQGTIQLKALSVEPNASGKGVVLVYKKRRHQQKPAKSLGKIELNRLAKDSEEYQNLLQQTLIQN